MTAYLLTNAVHERLKGMLRTKIWHLAVEESQQHMLNTEVRHHVSLQRASDHPQTHAGELQDWKALVLYEYVLRNRSASRDMGSSSLHIHLG